MSAVTQSAKAVERCHHFSVQYNRHCCCGRIFSDVHSHQMQTSKTYVIIMTIRTFGDAQVCRRGRVWRWCSNNMAVYVVRSPMCNASSAPTRNVFSGFLETGNRAKRRPVLLVDTRTLTIIIGLATWKASGLHRGGGRECRPITFPDDSSGCPGKWRYNAHARVCYHRSFGLINVVRSHISSRK